MRFLQGRVRRQQAPQRFDLPVGVGVLLCARQTQRDVDESLSEELTPGAEHAVQDGDQIRIGHSLIIYTDGDHPEAEKAMRGLRLIGEQRKPTLVGAEVVVGV